MPPLRPALSANGNTYQIKTDRPTRGNEEGCRCQCFCFAWRCQVWMCFFSNSSLVLMVSGVQWLLSLRVSLLLKRLLLLFWSYMYHIVILLTDCEGRALVEAFATFLKPLETNRTQKLPVLSSQATAAEVGPTTNRPLPILIRCCGESIGQKHNTGLSSTSYSIYRLFILSLCFQRCYSKRKTSLKSC